MKDAKRSYEQARAGKQHDRERALDDQQHGTRAG